MKREPNNSTDTERVILGIKYVGKDAEGRRCSGCAGISGVVFPCTDLPNCTAELRTDKRNLIFVAEAKRETP